MQTIEHTVVHVTITSMQHSYYAGQYEKSTFSVLDLKSSRKLSDLFTNDERVVILSEECYNNLLGNLTLNK
jgi:hypothetical protein